MTQTLTAQGRSPGAFPLPRFIPFLLLLLAACADPAPTGEADISVALQAVTASDVSKVTLTVSASDMSSSVVRDLQSAGGGTFKAILGGIPTGTNRTFLAQAFNASSVKIYEGQATGVTITPGGTVSVVILLQQSTPPTPFVNSAPRLTGLTTSSSQVKPGQAITLTATATDADGDALSYTWTATGGTLSSTNMSNPTWTAPSAEGTYTLSVSVSDNRGGQAGVSLKISVVGDRGSAEVSVSFNAWPVVSQVTGTPFGQVAPGGMVNLDVTVVETDGDALLYGWADDCGGSFNSSGVKSPSWTAPATAPTSGVCKVTVTVNDTRGGSTTGRLGIGVGLPTAFNKAPIIDQTFQSTNLYLAGDKVNLNVDAHDPEGTAVTFTWSASGGTLGTPTTSGTHSAVVWTAPAQINTYTLTVVVQDAAGQKTTQSFTIDSVLQNCVKVVTSLLNEVNPYSSPLTVAYSMVGGGAGSSSSSAGSSGTRASGTFTLGSGHLWVVVGGGGGYGNYWSGGLGGGGAGHYGGGSGGNSYGGAGSGGGGGSSVIATDDQLVAVAAGGSASESFGGGGGSNTGGTAGFNAPGYNNNPTAGTDGTGGHNKYSEAGDGPVGGGSTRSDSGGGGGWGGGGGGATASGTPGGTGGTWGDNGGGTGGLGANTWSTATTLPPAAGGVNLNGGGNAGLVILTYTAASCRL